MAISEAGRGELLSRVATKDMGLTVDETVGGLALIVLVHWRWQASTPDCSPQSPRC
jgi:hypothetical protein